jgi:MerR family redox-sensitive transcriptional activator SoxR
MRIGELARRFGVRASTVRYYESVGVLPPPARVSGRRVYGRDADEALLIVRALQGAGFTLAEIRRLRSLEPSRQTRGQWKDEAAAKLRELDARIAELRAARDMLSASLDCACEGRVADCALVTRTRGVAGAGARRGRRPPRVP